MLLPSIGKHKFADITVMHQVGYISKLTNVICYWMFTVVCNQIGYENFLRIHHACLALNVNTLPDCLPITKLDHASNTFLRFLIASPRL